MKVSFLTSGHDPFDDRIFYHMANSLVVKNNIVSIISSTCYKNDLVNGIKLNCFNGINLPKKEKAKEFISRLKEEDADVIICSEPLPVYAAYRYKKTHQKKSRIIYDITEWYPSKKKLCAYNHPYKCFHFIRLLSFNFWTSFLADGFIFGEYYKSRPYRFLFPLKPYVFVSYYPDLGYIRKRNPDLQNNRLRLSFSGKLSVNKGYENFINVIEKLSQNMPGVEIIVKVIGWSDDCEKIDWAMRLTQRKNIKVTHFGKLPFLIYLDTISDEDIFLDLRSDDWENSHSLPIRLFYYAAFERPVIFSDLKAISKDIDISSFGILVNPADTDVIVGLIKDYMENRSKYLKHCSAARDTIELKYNWKLIEQEFLKFISD